MRLCRRRRELVLQLLQRLGFGPRVPGLDLRLSGETRFHEVPQPIERQLAGELLHEGGARAEVRRRQLAAEDVHGLRDLTRCDAAGSARTGSHAYPRPWWLSFTVVFVAGLLGGSWAGPVGAVADEEGRVEDLEQERGQGQVKILRGESPP